MITASGMIPMVGLPEMRRGSLTFVTRPSTLAPTGIKVCPFTTTGCVMLARKGSPALLLNVASVVSSRTINAVPAGTGAFVCAASMVASSVQGNNIHFFMGPPKTRDLHLTVVQSGTADKRRAVHGEPPEVRGERIGRMDNPNLELVHKKSVGVRDRCNLHPI